MTDDERDTFYELAMIEIATARADTKRRALKSIRYGRRFQMGSAVVHAWLLADAALWRGGLDEWHAISVGAIIFAAWTIRDGRRREAWWHSR